MWFPDGFICLYNDDETAERFKTIGYFDGNGICSLYNGNSFILEVDADSSEENESQIDIISAINNGTFSDPSLDYAMNAL